MNLENSPVNWFDIVVLIVLLLGVSKGRKNGMSVELMVMVQWICILAACTFLYQPLGDWLTETSPMSKLFSYIAMYIAIAILVKGAFSLIKKGTGGKLVGSNVFGGAEYYLGMGAGAIRFLCILLAGVALLNARLYTAQELASKKAYDQKFYGSSFFPGLNSVQQQVFKESFLGSHLKKYAPFMLIVPTKPETKDLRRKDDLP